MPVRERTSMEPPSALSGSKELIACPGAISTLTVAVCAKAATAASPNTARLFMVSPREIISRLDAARVAHDRSVICESRGFPAGASDEDGGHAEPHRRTHVSNREFVNTAHAPPDGSGQLTEFSQPSAPDVR